MSEQWKTIVEPMPRLEAERALQHWIDSQAKIGRDYDKNQIRRDTILSKDRKELVRFAVLFAETKVAGTE